MYKPQQWGQSTVCGSEQEHNPLTGRGMGIYNCKNNIIYNTKAPLVESKWQNPQRPVWLRLSELMGLYEMRVEEQVEPSPERESGLYTVNNDKTLTFP